MSNWGLISTNTEILMLSLLGLATTLYEITKKDVDDPGEFIWDYQLPPYLEEGQYIIKSVIYGVELVRTFTVHIYIASYLLIFYPVLTEHRRFLLAPWLILTALRSILLNFVAFLLGIIICVTWDDSIIYPCVAFSVVKAAGMGWSMYFFLSVHNFYYDLCRPNVHWPDRKTILLSRLTSTKQEDKEAQYTDNLSILSSDISLLQEGVHGRRSAVESLLADATLEWFLNEAFGFDDVDDEEYERGLADRAEEFLNLTAKEILEQRNKICPHVEELVKHAKLKRCLDFLQTDRKTEGSTDTETKRSKDPLCRYPYLDINFENKTNVLCESGDDVEDDVQSCDLNCPVFKEQEDEKREMEKREQEENEIRLNAIENGLIREEMRKANNEKKVTNEKDIKVKQTESNDTTTKDESAQTAALTKSVETLFEKMQMKNLKKTEDYM